MQEEIQKTKDAMADKGEPFDLKPKDKKKKTGGRTSKPEDDDGFLENSLEDDGNL